MAEGHRGSFGGKWLPVSTLQPLRPHEILGATHVPVRWVPPEDAQTSLRLPAALQNPGTQELSCRILVGKLWAYSLMPSRGLDTLCPNSTSRTFPSSPSVCWPYPLPCTAPKGFILYSPPAAYTPQPNCITGIKN